MVGPLHEREEPLMRRLALCVCAFALTAGFVDTPVASAQQSLNLYIGRFTPSSEDSRGTITNGVSDDVLVNNLSDLSFNTTDFNGPTVGGEWLVALGNYLDAGLGLGLYSRTVPSVYTRFVNNDGSEIEQSLKLRVIPFTATIRFLPLGHHGAIQ